MRVSQASGVNGAHHNHKHTIVALDPNFSATQEKTCSLTLSGIAGNVLLYKGIGPFKDFEEKENSQKRYCADRLKHDSSF